MMNGQRLDIPTTEGAGIEFGFTVPSLLLVALVPLGAIIIAFAAYLVIFGTTDRTSWRLTAPPSGTELQIGVSVGGCDRFDRISLTEGDAVVLVEAYIRKNVRNACPAILLSEPKTVRLSAPLGGRALHGCNPPDSVYLESGYSDEDCANTYPH